MKEYLTYRIWDKNKKRMGTVYQLIYESTPPRLGSVTGIYRGKVDQLTLSEAVLHTNVNEVAVMMSTGLKDDKGVLIFEEDMIECMYPHPVLGKMEKIRARVIWNPYISHGEYGFAAIDEHMGIHPFRAIDNMIVVGNIFEGIKTT